MPTREVDTKMLREIVLLRHKEGVSYTDMAVDAGYKGKRRNVCTQLMQGLGICHRQTTTRGKKYKNFAQTISYRRATAIAKAVGIDPVDIGI